MGNVDVTKIYNEENKCCYWWEDYQPMLNEFGKIIIQDEDRGYSGDTRVLYEENEKIGHLVFGWGSCSGCDALQACRTIDDVQELCNELQDSILWFNTAKDALDYFENHDWEGDYDYSRKYVDDCIQYLKNKIKKA